MYGCKKITDVIFTNSGNTVAINFRYDHQGKMEHFASFYPDENHFTASDFKGLTKMQAYEVYYSRINFMRAE